MLNPPERPKTYAVFQGPRLLLADSLEPVLRRVMAAQAQDPLAPLLIFDETSGRQVDFDLRGDLDAVLARAQPTPAKAGPGRPRLGVTAREVTLLPRHWDWLEQQPQGSSAALRRLIDEARKREPDRAQARRLREAVGTLMWNLAGDLPNFEDTSRSLYAGDLKGFKAQVAGWPKDIRTYLTRRLETAARLEQGTSA